MFRYVMAASLMLLQSGLLAVEPDGEGGSPKAHDSNTGETASSSLDARWAISDVGADAMPCRAFLYKKPAIPVVLPFWVKILEECRAGSPGSWRSLASDTNARGIGRLKGFVCSYVLKEQQAPMRYDRDLVDDRWGYLEFARICISGVLSDHGRTIYNDEDFYYAAVVAFQLGDGDLARCAFRRYLSGSGFRGQEAEAYLALGEIHFSAGEYSLALDFLSKAVAGSKTDSSIASQAAYLASWSYFRLGDLSCGMSLYGGILSHPLMVDGGYGEKKYGTWSTREISGVVTNAVYQDQVRLELYLKGIKSKLPSQCGFDLDDSVRPKSSDSKD